MVGNYTDRDLVEVATASQVELLKRIHRNLLELRIGPAASLDSPLSSVARETTLAALLGELPASLGPQPVSGSLSVTPATASRFSVTEPILDIARGLVPGSSLVSKFGTNRDIDAGTAEDVSDFGGIYTFPTAASVLSLVSSDAADTAAGTGARTVLVSGEDTNYAVISETVTLAGLTPVATALSYFRVNSCVVVTVGSAGSNVGVVTGTHTGAPQFAVQPGANVSQVSHSTIPAGFTVFITQIQFSGSQNSASAIVEGKLLIREFGSVFKVRDNFMTGTTASGQVVGYPSMIRVPEKSDVRVVATASANNTAVHIRYDGILVVN